MRYKNATVTGRGLLEMIRVLTIIEILSVGAIVGEASAGCSNNPCRTWNPGVENNCGKGCTYTYENGTAYISVKGKDAIMERGTFVFDFYDGNQLPVIINNIVIDGPIALDDIATYGNKTISGANGELIFTHLGGNPFGWTNTILTGNIIFPSEATFSSSYAFLGVSLAPGAKIYCAIENCAQKMRESCMSPSYPLAKSQCLTIVNNIVSSSDKFEQAPENCVLFSVSGCIKCKNENFKLNDGECDRLRWTPAEAAKVLHDDNTNSVTITFKK